MSTVCLSMIVKNETKILHECLDSVHPHIDYWVIVDTGSTDGTQEYIKQYFAEKGIPGELIERPWINFGHNRSEALDLCTGKADYAWRIQVSLRQEPHR
jgi:glycosyltransferase involved in cell wall biosynthesis